MQTKELLLKYFDYISDEKLAKLAELNALYSEWNQKINVISRKDIANFDERHLLHSLSIAKIISFKAGTKIMDVGTGGGLPGIPLAILFPEADFLLVDSIGKKLKVVDDICAQLHIENVQTKHDRAENIPQSFDFIISRAVSNIPLFMSWVQYKIKKEAFNELKNGVLYIKGGEVEEEMKAIKQQSKTYAISDFYEEEFFKTKKILHIF